MVRSSICRRPTLRPPVTSARVIAAVIVSVLVVALSVGCASSVSRADIAREYYNLANAYQELERYGEAAEFYRRALEWAGREGIPQDAGDAISAAGEVPNTPVGLQRDIRYNLALAYARAGEPEKAIPILEAMQEEERTIASRASGTQGDDGGSREVNRLIGAALAYAHHRNGNSTEALAIYDRMEAAVGALGPNELFNKALILEALLNRAVAELQPDDPPADASSADASSAPSPSPDPPDSDPDIDPEIDRLRSRLMETLRQTVAAAPNDAEAATMLARYAMDAEDYATVVDALTPIVERDREAVEAALYLAEAHLRMERFDLALPLTQRLVTGDDVSGKAWFLRAFALLGGSQEASDGVEALTKAIAGRFRDPDAFEWVLSIPGLPEEDQIRRILGMPRQGESGEVEPPTEGEPDEESETTPRADS